MTTATRHIVVGRPRFGPLVGAGLVLVYAVLWYLYRPSSGITLSYLGEILGVEAIVFMAAWSMAMVTVLPGMEDAYGGLDRQLAWHRRTAVIGTILMIAHQQITFGGLRSGVGGNLANVSFYGILALIVWALLGPTTRAARWRGPIGWLARVRYDVWLPLHRITVCCSSPPWSTGCCRIARWTAHPFSRSAIWRSAHSGWRPTSTANCSCAISCPSSPTPSTRSSGPPNACSSSPSPRGAPRFG
jgi:hypothetical protein